MIGGGYGDGAWLARQFQEAGSAAVGCGFITWSISSKRDLVDLALQRQPKALMLSFGDPAPLAPAIHAVGVPLICQCQAWSTSAKASAPEQARLSPRVRRIMRPP